MALNKNILIKYKLVIDEWFANSFDSSAAYMKYFETNNIKTATTSFMRMRKHKEVQEYIDEKYKKAAGKLDATHESILKKLLEWAQFDVTEAIGLTKNEIKLLPLSIRQAITGHKIRTKKKYNKSGNLVYTEEYIDLQFINKEKIIDMINKHVGFYEVDNKQKSISVDLSGLTYEQLKDIAE